MPNKTYQITEDEIIEMFDKTFGKDTLLVIEETEENLANIAFDCSEAPRLVAKAILNLINSKQGGK